MSKLTAQAGNQNKPFKPKTYQGERRGKTRNYYNQGKYKIYIDQIVRIGSMSFRGRAQYRQNYRGRLQYVNNYRSDFRRGNFRGTQNYRGQNLRVGYRGSY